LFPSVLGRRVITVVPLDVMARARPPTMGEIERAATKIRNYLDGHKLPGWDEKRDSYLQGWDYLTDLLVSLWGRLGWRQRWRGEREGEKINEGRGMMSDDSIG